MLSVTCPAALGTATVAASAGRGDVCAEGTALVQAVRARAEPTAPASRRGTDRRAPLVMLLGRPACAFRFRPVAAFTATGDPRARPVRDRPRRFAAGGPAPAGGLPGGGRGG